MQENPEKFALHRAAMGGNVTLAEALLKSDSRLAKRKDDDGRLPVHWAASSNCLGIVQLLAQLPGFDPDVQDDSGWTPLMIAASLRDSDAIVSLMLQKGADVNQKNFSGQTALHFIASKGNMDLAHQLFAHHPPASTRVRDVRGQYPIHRAAAVGATPMVRLLLKNKSPLDATDSSGYTALHHAVAEGHGDTAVALLSCGADSTKKDNDGNLAIELASDKEVRRYIERTAEREGIEI